MIYAHPHQAQSLVKMRFRCAALVSGWDSTPMALSVSCRNQVLFLLGLVMIYLQNWNKVSRMFHISSQQDSLLDAPHALMCTVWALKDCLITLNIMISHVFKLNWKTLRDKHRYIFKCRSSYFCYNLCTEWNFGVFFTFGSTHSSTWYSSLLYFHYLFHQNFWFLVLPNAEMLFTCLFWSTKNSLTIRLIFKCRSSHLNTGVTLGSCLQ